MVSENIHHKQVGKVLRTHSISTWSKVKAQPFQKLSRCFKPNTAGLLEHLRSLLGLQALTHLSGFTWQEKGKFFSFAGSMLMVRGSLPSDASRIQCQKAAPPG